MAPRQFGLVHCLATEMFQEVGIDLVGDFRVRSGARPGRPGRRRGPGLRAGRRVVPSDAPITCEVLTCVTSERGPNAKGLMVMKKSTFRNEPINEFHFIPDAPCRLSSRGGRFPQAAIRVAAARCRNEPISRSACKSRAHLETRGRPPVHGSPARCRPLPQQYRFAASTAAGRSDPAPSDSLLRKPLASLRKQRKGARKRVRKNCLAS